MDIHSNTKLLHYVPQLRLKALLSDEYIDKAVRTAFGDMDCPSTNLIDEAWKLKSRIQHQLLVFERVLEEIQSSYSCFSENQVDELVNAFHAKLDQNLRPLVLQVIGQNGGSLLLEQSQEINNMVAAYTSPENVTQTEATQEFIERLAKVARNIN